jgi:hypothetical protein
VEIGIIERKSISSGTKEAAIIQIKGKKENKTIIIIMVNLIISFNDISIFLSTISLYLSL